MWKKRDRLSEAEKIARQVGEKYRVDNKDKPLVDSQTDRAYEWYKAQQEALRQRR